MLALIFYTGVTVLSYNCVHHQNALFEDNSHVLSAPFYSIIGFILLYRYYENVVQRIAYIGILVYWYIAIARPGYGNTNMFSTLFTELIRMSKDGRGPTDTSGQHWTLKIAESFLLLGIGIITERYWKNYYWIMTLFTVMLTIFVLGNYVFHLWMQKQIARLTRYNRHAWTWRDLIVEYSVRSIMRKLGSPKSRAIARMWYAMWFCIYRHMTTKRTLRVSRDLFLIRLIYSSELLDYGIQWLGLWLFCIREFARFANPDAPPYKYEMLKGRDHIRVLLLQPTFGFRPVSCNLIQGPHMRSLFYEAISYTWGGVERTQQIMVDGCTMKVTESVYEILSSYSSLIVPKLLWIDALCIDQGNAEEKALQVPLMQKIYQSALHTTVFLGRAPTTYHRTLDGTPIIMPYRYDGIYAPDGATKDHIDGAKAVIELFNEFHIFKDGALRRSAKTIYELYEMLRSTKSKPK